MIDEDDAYLPRRPLTEHDLIQVLRSQATMNRRVASYMKKHDLDLISAATFVSALQSWSAAKKPATKAAAAARLADLKRRYRITS